MNEYPKIQTIFLRDPATKYKSVLYGHYSKPEFEYLQYTKWVFTEKVDGTNIRVFWDGVGVGFGGKTDRAQIPAFLVNRLKELFPPERFLAHSHDPLCLYGEGYGAKIQKGGGDYLRDGVDFILFDVWCGMWLERHNVEDIAGKLDIGVVPVVARGNLLDGIERAQEGFASCLRDTPPEGLVMRPQVELLDRRGERVITKIKLKDFQSCTGCREERDHEDT